VGESPLFVAPKALRAVLDMLRMGKTERQQQGDRATRDIVPQALCGTPGQGQDQGQGQGQNDRHVWG